MMRKISLLFAGALMGAASVIAVSGHGMMSANAAGNDTYRQLAIFGDIFERIRANYVEEPEDRDLIENAINGMLAALDPHSSYLNADDAADMRTQTKGEFGGLGIEVTMEDELVKVITPMFGTPAEKAGVLAGDLIVEIDGTEVRGLTLQQAVDMMRGLVNTPIELKILREGADKPIDITIVRDIIKIQAVRYRTEDDIGYLRVISFTEQTFDDLQSAIEDLSEDIGEDKLKGYVLDLRLNPGGLLDQAINVSDAFLDKGLIVSTRGRDDRDSRRYSARPGDLTGGQPLIVLGQWRLGERVGDRRRRAAGSPPRDHRRQPLLRQGFRPDDHSARRERRAAPDHGALLHAGRNLDPGQGHHAGYLGQPDDPRRASRPRPDARRIRSARSYRGRGRGRERLRLDRLCAAGSGGRRSTRLRAGTVARRAHRPGLPAGPGDRPAELTLLAASVNCPAAAPSAAGHTSSPPRVTREVVAFPQDFVDRLVGSSSPARRAAGAKRQLNIFQNSRVVRVS